MPYPGGDILLYIGATVDLRRRWQRHQRMDEIVFIKGVYLAWLRCQESRLAALEDYYIRAFKPELNNKPRAHLADIELDKENLEGFLGE
ncbi:GIY-YIG nuclease family protein [Nostoc sp. FACHB-87]|uniref:GIY-YIG nuclease family protein n=1 Tax=Nostocaceae TaxID=1162 RepID=UPI0016822DFE|nr:MULTISPECIES: GIY-YIG nuclease family protein [Nostocaceae]MBD2457986.1 GIY-YIG nuclease family protein [Nostoc sp. FACHB-87]MBD2479237.1 GIY-YIG nuclease family protein [Anabaena sp. FACHB-83]